MASKYIPGSTNAILIGDSVNGATPSPTKVNADGVNACLEIQSTTRAAVFAKPMTDAQIALIPNPISGMIAFSSTTNKPVFRGAAAWETLNSVLAPQYASVALTTANIQGMSAAPFEILPALAGGLTYIVHGARFSVVYAGALFTNGGIINLQYGITALGAGDDASNTIAATILTTNAYSKFVYIAGNDTTVISSAGSLNQSITITNTTAPFALGGTSTGKVEVWYSIV